MALVLTVEDGTGLAAANSYASQAEADAYFDAHLYAAAWSGASSGDKDKALAMATRLIEAHTTWAYGERIGTTQALSWPRYNAWLDGFELSASAVPQAVKNATCELAMLLISNNLTADVDQNNLSSISLGSGALDLAFNDKPKRQIPFHVSALLRGLGRIMGGGSFTQVKVSR